MLDFFIILSFLWAFFAIIHVFWEAFQHKHVPDSEDGDLTEQDVIDDYLQRQQEQQDEDDYYLEKRRND